MANPTFSFGLKPKDAIAYLKKKRLKQSFAYNEIMHEAHHKSFTVAKVMRDDLLSDIQSSLLKAQADGIGFKEWHKNIKPMLVDYGWYGETTVADPQTGEVKNIFVGSRRLKNIFNTNMRVSYAVARYHKLKALPFSKYWMYISMLLPTTRTTHAAKHGKVLHRDDAWWRTNYPPNAWGCKCKVRAYTKAQLEQKGIKVTTHLENIAHKDWAYPVGEGAKELKNLRANAIEKLLPSLQRVAKEGLKVEELYTKAIANAPLGLQNYLFKHRPIIQKDSVPHAYYRVSQQTVVYTDTMQLSTLRHELGHHIDNINDFVSLKMLNRTIKLDQLELMKNKYKEEIASLNITEVAINDLFYLNSSKKIGLQTRNDEYLITSSKTIKETFANVFEIILSNNQQRVKLVEQYFPNTLKAIYKIMEELHVSR